MSDTNYRVEADRITIYPRWGTGWSTVLDQTRHQITMQPCILGVKLPLGRRVPYAQIGRISSVCRETWWSRVWLAHSIGNPRESSPMPNKGWVYDLLMTVKGNRKPVKIGTVESPDIATEVEWEARQRLGLSEM